MQGRTFDPPAATRESVRLGAFTLLAAAAAGAAGFASGVLFWLLAALVASTALIALRHLARAGAACVGAAPGLAWLQNLALLAATVLICASVMEGFLWVEERRGVAAATTPAVTAGIPREAATGSADAPEASLPTEQRDAMASRAALVTLPKEWERRLIKIEGAKGAYSWHGVVHVLDAYGFRRLAPFPPKQPEVCRVMVVGDSFTYGEGIEERWGYVANLQRSLQRDYRVEFLNLGIQAYHSEDIVKVVRSGSPSSSPISSSAGFA